MRIFEISCKPKGPQQYDWKFVGLFVAPNEIQAIAEGKSARCGTDIDLAHSLEFEAKEWNGDKRPMWKEEW